ncbi:hypothetical protein Pmar_PMAR019093, partial [Perkinsus marinus ATCC 50983]
FCTRHGGGRPCRYQGCHVAARGLLGYCYKHRHLANPHIISKPTRGGPKGSKGRSSNVKSSTARHKAPAFEPTIFLPFDLNATVIRVDIHVAVSGHHPVVKLLWTALPSR